MKITDVSLFKVRGAYTGPYFPPGDRQAQMMDIYPEFNAQAMSGRRRGNAHKGVCCRRPIAAPAAQLK